MGPGSEGSKSDLGEPLPKAKMAKPEVPVPEMGLVGNGQPPLPLVQDDKVIERVGPEGQQSIVQRYTEQAVKFIKNNQTKPFFFYLAHNAIHFPLYPSKAFHTKSKNGLIGDWIEEVDWSVGEVLNALRDLKLDASTLVIFTSDNGGTPRSVNTPLRGNKGSTWEGGMRVPTLAWWPGKIATGSSTAEITSMMDVLPTCASLAGASLPKRKIDGSNLWPLLSGEAGARPHEVFYFYHGFNLQAVRSGDWKLQIAGGDAPKNAKKKQPAAKQDGFPRLYNLKDDIGESKNIAAAHPEVVKRLQAFVQKMEDDLGVSKLGPGVRELGRVSNPQPLIHTDGTIREGFQP